MQNMEIVPDLFVSMMVIFPKEKDKFYFMKKAN